MAMPTLRCRAPQEFTQLLNFPITQSKWDFWLECIGWNTVLSSYETLPPVDNL